MRQPIQLAPALAGLSTAVIRIEKEIRNKWAAGVELFPTTDTDDSYTLHDREGHYSSPFLQALESSA